MARLHDRYPGWALVTGASAGLGVHFAEQLAAEGFPLILTARREERLRKLADRLPTETHVVPLDLTEPDACERLVAAAGDREVSMLVANAGFGFSGRFDQQDAERSARMVQLNCTVPTLLFHAFLPPMRDRKNGAVVIVSSVAGFQPTPFFAVYGATKAFDLMLGEALWEECRGTGVDVVTLCPGSTETEFAQHAHMQDDKPGMAAGPVVAASLRKLGRGPTVVTGLMNKINASAHRFLPRSWVASITGRVLAGQLLGKSPDAVRRS
jgi:short-subunit dehydrogenase